MEICYHDTSQGFSPPCAFRKSVVTSLCVSVCVCVRCTLIDFALCGCCFCWCLWSICACFHVATVRRGMASRWSFKCRLPRAECLLPSAWLLTCRRWRQPENCCYFDPPFGQSQGEGRRRRCHCHFWGALFAARECKVLGPSTQT